MHLIYFSNHRCLRRDLLAVIHQRGRNSFSNILDIWQDLACDMCSYLFIQLT